MGGDREDDRVRAGFPVAGDLARAALGHRHHPASRGGSRRGVRAARLAGPRPEDQRADPPVRQVAGDLLIGSRSAWPARSPATCWPRPGRPGRRGRSARSCPACRSWSWPWGRAGSHAARRRRGPRCAARHAWAASGPAVCVLVPGGPGRTRLQAAGGGPGPVRGSGPERSRARTTTRPQKRGTWPAPRQITGGSGPRGRPEAGRGGEAGVTAGVAQRRRHWV